MKLTKTQKYLLAGGLAFVLIAIGAAAVLLGKEGRGTTASEETTSSAEASWTVEATGTASIPETAPVDPDAPPLQTQPSYERYVRIRAVGGKPGNYTIEADFFEIYTEAEAEEYASKNGLTVPDNGILYVDEEATTEMIPLRSDVVIIYKAGGVESLVQLKATVEQLRDWTLGSTSALDGAMTDMWKITVVEGIATQIEMVAVAD